jgi:hypothetical protein
MNFSVNLRLFLGLLDVQSLTLLLTITELIILQTFELYLRGYLKLFTKRFPIIFVMRKKH